MQKIHCDHASFKEWFTVKVDTNKLCFESVGRNTFGQYILMKSSTTNMSSAYGTSDEYYLITLAELKRCAGDAKGRGYLSKEEYKEIMAL